MTYRAVVELWAAERESLQYVLPYTARKAAQKALLFSPWMAEAEIDQIEPSQVSAALMYLGSKGGRQKRALDGYAQGSASSRQPSMRLGG